MAFCRDVTPFSVYVCMSQGHSSVAYHSRKLKFSTFVTSDKTFKYMVRLSWSHASGLS